MASLAQERNGNYHIVFWFGGTRFKRSLKTSNLKKAHAAKARLEDTLQMVEMGRLEVPKDADVATFFLTDGKQQGKPVFKEARLDTLFDQYFSSMPTGCLEVGTIRTMKLHRTRIESILGKRYVLRQLSHNDLRRYVNERSEHDGIRGRKLNAVTIKKELATLRGLWKWAMACGEVPAREFPSVGLRYPKTSELPSFQTLDQVLALTKNSEADSPKAKDLWATVFLNREEIEELLDLVQQNAHHDFLYPMFVLAAHTGARRSEIMRSVITDIGADKITIREQKRRKGKESTREVPLTSRLQEALTTWKLQHPANTTSTFCHTRNKWCHSNVGDALTADEMNRHYKTVLKGSRFQHLRGWHVFRHSFCSNCAAAGVDQRLIDAWVGHTTDEMRRRYRHLFPNRSQQALKEVFG